MMQEQDIQRAHKIETALGVKKGQLERRYSEGGAITHLLVPVDRIENILKDREEFRRLYEETQRRATEIT